ncbi:hypothetical protein P7K49_035899 [Saguinus oedipus]|uniref:Uncharacterized protein n=1 Tax=Saguinus oedipus TaxID=9490 RepID=A0ABQ9TNY3_SAGOE|nr:hypothetical protein P7K49_035899 [Saguinus oedipus]
MDPVDEAWSLAGQAMLLEVQGTPVHGVRASTPSALQTSTNCSLPEFCTDFHSRLFLTCFMLVLTQSSIFSLLAMAINRDAQVGKEDDHSPVTCKFLVVNPTVYDHCNRDFHYTFHNTIYRHVHCQTDVKSGNGQVRAQPALSVACEPGSVLFEEKTQMHNGTKQDQLILIVKDSYTSQA